MMTASPTVHARCRPALMTQALQQRIPQRPAPGKTTIRLPPPPARSTKLQPENGEADRGLWRKRNHACTLPLEDKKIYGYSFGRACLWLWGIIADSVPTPCAKGILAVSGDL